MTLLDLSVKYIYYSEVSIVMDVKLIMIIVLMLTSSLALDNSTLTDMYIQISSDVGTLKTRTDVIETRLATVTNSLESQGESVQQLVDLYEQNVIPNFINESLLRIFVVGVVLLNVGVNAMLVIYLAGVVKKYGKQETFRKEDQGGAVSISSPVQKISLLDKLRNRFTGKQKQISSNINQQVGHPVIPSAQKSQKKE